MAKIWNVYIVRTPEGESLQVLRIVEYGDNVEPPELRTTEFIVYKVDYEKLSVALEPASQPQLGRDYPDLCPVLP
ncbi:hypothetical protein EJB05_29468, partial [Eragrostis curvula]